MENIAREFFKPEKPNLGDMEDKMLFFIDNYPNMIRKYRIMMKQHVEVQKRKEQAQIDLQELRKQIEEIESSGKTLSEQEKLEIEMRKDYLSALREEDGIIYYYGEPMNYDVESALIIKYQLLFKYIEMADSSIRKRVGKTTSSVVGLATRPLSSVLKFSLKRSKNKNIKMALKDAKKLIDELPEKMRNKVTSSIDVDLKRHVP
jgi:RNase adaptor protein for sRNA GlmZ degradation